MRKILIIEKDEDILQIISQILSEEGYSVSSSRTEKGIFDLIQEVKPDAILLDIMKPTAQGTEVCRAIKDHEKFKHIPVIVLSTFMQVDIFKEICADEVIPKPFDIDLLLQVIEDHLAA